MPLEQKDFERIERIIYKTGDDIAVSIARSFERLEERIDGLDSSLRRRLKEVENSVEDCHLRITDELVRDPDEK